MHINQYHKYKFYIGKHQVLQYKKKMLLKQESWVQFIYVIVKLNYINQNIWSLKWNIDK